VSTAERNSKKNSRAGKNTRESWSWNMRDANTSRVATTTRNGMLTTEGTQAATGDTTTAGTVHWQQQGRQKNEKL